MIVSAGTEILFRPHVSTASVRSFPRVGHGVGHGVGQPFLQVRRVKTPPKMGSHASAILACAEIQPNKSAHHAQKLRRSNQRLQKI